jgi:hypothetical protein
MPPSAWISLAGLFVAMSAYGATFSYFLGKQSQRITNLERDANREAGLSEKVTRLEVQVEHAVKELESLGRTMQGVNRQLANIATGKGGVFHLAEPQQ